MYISVTMATADYKHHNVFWTSKPCASSGNHHFRETAQDERRRWTPSRSVSGSISENITQICERMTSRITVQTMKSVCSAFVLYPSGVTTGSIKSHCECVLGGGHDILPIFLFLFIKFSYLRWYSTAQPCFMLFMNLFSYLFLCRCVCEIEWEIKRDLT